MKARHLATFLAALLFVSTSSHAQRNVVKLNLSSIALLNLSIQDEYAISGHSSVALGLSYLAPRGVRPEVVKEESRDNVANLSFNGFSITPEYRYYFSNKAPKGFYVAGYFRYSDYTMDNFAYEYVDGAGNKEYYNLSGYWEVRGVGLMVGSQWQFGKHFTLDWWIVGAAAGTNGGKFNGTGPLTEEEQHYIKESLDKIQLNVGDIAYTVTSNSVEVIYDTGLPSFRAMGICIGYAFGGSKSSGQ